MPGLDGVRAIAVLAVLCYHLDISGFFPAGFLGVDLFFVLSGYLITSQLLREYARHGGIALREFYLKRARRLFPAVIALLVMAVLVSEWLAPDAVRRTRTDVLPALFYVSNWWQIFSEQSYFEMSGRPPLLQHLWSLAIEEQFYIVWPLALLLALRAGFRRHLPWLSLGLMLLSGGWMILLSLQRGYPEADPSRAYLGTDTHAFGLFAGAALAALWDPRARRIAQAVPAAPASSPWGQPPATAADWLGLAALTALLGAMLAIGETDPLWYRGGFLVFAALAVVLLYTATQPTGSLPVLLSQQPLAWIGQRSYSLYLWHWPIFALLRPEFELPDHRLLQAVVRLALTALVAELSYRYIEQPVRSGALAGWPRARRVRWLSVTSSLVIAAVAVALWRPMPPAAMALETMPAETAASASEALQVQQVSAEDARSADDPASAEPYRSAREVCGRTVQAARERHDRPQLTLIGDSVLLGASEYLLRRLHGVEVDAAVGRQAKDGLQKVEELKAQDALADTVVLHLGTNGFLGENYLREMLEELSDRETVVLVNVKVPRRWEQPNNALIARIAHDFPNVTVLDWYAISRQRPDFFVSDRIHLSGKGIRSLSAEIARVSGDHVLADKAAMRSLQVLPCLRASVQASVQ